MPRSPHDSTRTRIISGHPLRVRDAGPRDGEALLIINGSAGNLAVLDPLITRLAATRRVLAFDQPGMGHSPAVYPTLDVPGLARLCARVLADAGVSRVDVVGYSFGGAVAQQLALTRPDLVRRLILVAGVYGAGGIPSDPLSSLSVLAHQTPAQPFCREPARRAYGGVVARDDAALTAYEEAIAAAPPDPLSIVGQAVAASIWCGLPWLWALRVPTLVVTGDQDHVVPMSNARIISALLPQSRLEVVPGAGHLLVMDQADDVAALIEAFLSPSLGADAGGSVADVVSLTAATGRRPRSKSA